MTKDVDFSALRITLSDRYTLMRPLASGGMAEIFLARQKAMAGFEKHVAVKLLRDRYRNDPRVLEMFVNEARVGAVLSHSNIVHVYDIGEHDRQPFIVMEHIQGEELSQLCRRGLELAHFLPLEHAVDLVRQAAEALGYVHARRDEAGRSLEIVHRDISPSNLLITTEGVLKIIDFGIARARWGSEDSSAQDKLVPGKYNYMSPEQVRGEQVDHRSDVFSLGIVLYEITVGKRLFKGRPEEVMQKVTRGRIKPPTFIRRQFPPALERIVMRALEAHRDDRYATAYELAADLEEFLRDAGLKSGPVRIAQYLDELRAAETGERRPELIIAGEAWLDDDGEEALDFDRGFAPSASTSGKPSTGPTSLARARDLETPKAEERAAEAPAAPEPPAAVVAPAPMVAPVSAPANEEEEPSTRVASNVLPAETVPLRKSASPEDELTNVHGISEKLAALVEPPIDPDLGEDIPTDVGSLPSMEALPEEDARLPVTTPTKTAPRPQPATPIVLPEPTGRVALTAVTNKVPLVPIPMPFGTSRVGLARESGRISVPLRAEPTGRVPLAPTPPLPPKAPPPPVPVRVAAPILDPSMTGDTPLPPPALYDDTSRHMLTDPLHEGFAAATGIRMLKAEPAAPLLKEKAENMADSMSVTLGVETPVTAKERPPISIRGRKHAKKARPRYRPRSLSNLEITPDPVVPVAFGGGILEKRRRKAIPWPLIIGAGLALLLIILLITR